MKKYQLSKAYKPTAPHNMRAYLAVRALFKECNHVPLSKISLACVVPKNHPQGSAEGFIEYLISMSVLRRVS